ncbi:MAG: 5-oxoprolinase [Rhodospirillaceae bacterium]|nr:5-oxoprolinase [Rhodospirillaceae bacterium]OUU28600.1 MAG: 5-oxoprolinase [Candidatus Endolissoclinum sp. TMED37]
MDNKCRIGIDVGGTFTDIVAVSDTGTVTFSKAASTPNDPSIGVMNAVERLADELGINSETLLSKTESIVHGTTVATNALLERKGAKTGLLTTLGHRDVLEMREGLKDDRYNMRLPAPAPVVPRFLRLGVRERIKPDGSIHTKLDDASLNEAINKLREEKVTSVAVCYLHAYKEPKHEQETKKILEEKLPGVSVSISSEVFPEIKEYERVSTTILNAYVRPIVENYLNRLEERLKNAGYKGSVLIILSHGGVAPIEEAVRLSAATVLSGPAGGVAGSKYGASLIGAGDLVPFDMGGTSTDISMIVNGEPALSSTRGIAGQRIALQSLDIVSIASGGGSIARVDAGGILRVGPESAGALPGPACYGKGGAEVAVTDASVVLGFLDPGNFLGGRETLDVAAAEAALSRLANRLSVEPAEAAEGVHKVINTQMAEGIRLVSVRRGVDPRKFALLSFGGAAGIHVTEIARQLEVQRVIVPRTAAVLSAWGMLATDLRYEVSRTHIGDTGSLKAGDVREVFSEMELEGRSRLKEAFEGDVSISRSADMRYGEQIYEVDVSLDDVDFNEDDIMKSISDRFHKRHEELFTYSLPDQDAVLVNGRLAAIGALPDLPQEPKTEARAASGHHTTRKIFLAGWVDAPVFNLEELVPSQEIEGPAIIESSTTTVVLRSDDKAEVTDNLWLNILVGKQ